MMRGRLFGASGKVVKSLLACVLAGGFIALPGQAQIVTLTDGNSVAQVNAASQLGMFNWTVNGVSQLNRQWFWLATGSAAPSSIDTISAPAISQSAANVATTAYTGVGFNLSITYTLTGGATGGPVGTKLSDIGEAIRINNVSASPLSLHFYQYSDFNLLGSPGNENVELSKLHSLFADAYQLKVISGNTVGIGETIVSPGANHGEAELAGITLAKLTGGLPVTLSDAMTAGVGDVTWAFQWDVTINPGDSFIISKDKRLEVTIVPEPSVFALLGLGVGAFLIRRRRQRA